LERRASFAQIKRNLMQREWHLSIDVPAMAGTLRQLLCLQMRAKRIRLAVLLRYINITRYLAPVLIHWPAECLAPLSLASEILLINGRWKDLWRPMRRRINLRATWWASLDRELLWGAWEIQRRIPL